MKSLDECHDLLVQGVRERKKELIEEARNEAAPWSLPKIVLSMTGVDLVGTKGHGSNYLPKDGEPTSEVVDRIAMALCGSIFIADTLDNEARDIIQSRISLLDQWAETENLETAARFLIENRCERKVPATTAADSILLLKPFVFPRYISEAVKAYTERIRQHNRKLMQEEEERVRARRAEQENRVHLDIMRNGHSLAAATLKGPGAWDIAEVLCKSLASGPQFSDSFLRITSGPESREIPLDLGGKFDEEEEEE